MGMAASGDEELESTLSSFDAIYDDFKKGISHIQSLQSNCNTEIKKQQALEFTVNSLKAENGRLTKLYTDSLNKMADQLEHHTKCHSLKEELERVRDERVREENEHRKTMESLKQDQAARIKELENQIRCFIVQKVANEETINQLHQNLAADRNQIEALSSRLAQVQSGMESRYQYEIRDLKDCLSIEGEEKNVLNKQLQNYEKELLISRTKLVELQRDLTSNRNVEALKQKIMKLRKENEVLKRQLLVFKEG